MRDIVALIGSCVYRRKHAQDEIMRRNGILLLLQQCFTHEDNHFLREKRIKSLLLS
jgi:ataxin-10